MRVLDSRRKWDSTQYLLAIVCDRLAVLNWQLGGEKPTPLPRPEEPSEEEDNEPITRSEIDRILSGKREEVWM